METIVSRKMMLGDPPEIRITRHDLSLLDAVVTGAAPSSRTVEFLRGELERATIVGDADAAGVVKLGTCVEFTDETGRTYVRTVGFRHDDSGHPNLLSVLTPVGAALLGLAPGQSIAYKTVDGRTKTLTVRRLLAAS